MMDRCGLQWWRNLLAFQVSEWCFRCRFRHCFKNKMSPVYLKARNLFLFDAQMQWVWQVCGCLRACVCVWSVHVWFTLH